MIEPLAIVGLALLWSVLSGTNTPFGLLVGALLGLALLSLIQRRQARSFPRRLLALIRFAFRFLGELVVANVTIARLAVSPRPSYHPHIIAVPLRVESDAAISLLSGAITVLPGTVAMGTIARSHEACTPTPLVPPIPQRRGPAWYGSRR